MFWVRSTPPGATVTLGDEVLGRTPVRVRLDPRLEQIVLLLTRRGYDRTRVSLRAAGPRTVHARLRRPTGWIDPFASSRKARPRRANKRGKLVNPFDE